jgi:hypothetical protein
MYEIKDYTYNQAMKYGVILLPSKKKNKKIDVYDKDLNYLVSIGDIRYKDFPSYLESHGKGYALRRRDLYHSRHKNYKKGTAGWYAKNLLW